MKRNIIRLSLVVIVGGVGWFAISQIRQSQDPTTQQDSLATTADSQELADSELQPTFIARQSEPVPLQPGPANSNTQQPLPSRYDLGQPATSPLQGAQETNSLQGTLPDNETLPYGTSPDESDARLPGDLSPPTAAQNATPDNEFASDPEQTDPSGYGRETTSQKYGDSSLDTPAAVPPSTKAPTPLSAASQLRGADELGSSDAYATMRGQDELPATDQTGRYSTPPVADGGFPSPDAAMTLPIQEADQPGAAGNFSPPPIAENPLPSRDSIYSQDPTISGSDSFGSGALVSEEGNGRPGGEQLEGAQTPGLTLQKFAPAEIQIGKESTFTIKVLNTGQIAAHGVELHDDIPYGTRLVSTKPPADRGPDGKLIWALGSLGIGEEATVEVRLMPTAEGEIGSVATLHFEAQASARTISTRPALALRVTAPHEVMIGEDILVEIEVGNPGSGAATGVMLIENVPDGLSHPAGKALEFEIGTLEPGETRQLKLVLTAEEAGQIVNNLIVRGDASLEVQESVEVEVIAPRLQVGLSGPTRRYLERQASYTVSVNNPGTAAALDVELVTRLPKGMKFVKANNSGMYDSATRSVYWSLAELPAKQTGAVELVVIPVETGELTLHVEGKAEQGLQHSAEQKVLVEGISAIMFEVVDIADPIEVGGETTYEIRVVNQGSKAAENVRVVAEIPPGMTAISAGGPTKHTLQGSRVQFMPLRRLAPKADTTYRIQVRGDQDGDLRVRVQIITDEIEQPITKEESTRVYKDE